MDERKLADLREALVDGQVTDGYRGLDVRLDGDDIVIVFRWRKDPNVYAVRRPADAYELDEASDWLMEELDTGLVRRAPRRAVSDWIELDVGSSYPHEHPSTYVSPVPTVDTGAIGARFNGKWLWESARRPAPGAFLRRSGFEVGPAQESLRRGSLLGWNVLWTNDRSPRALGHGAIARTMHPDQADLFDLQFSHDTASAAVSSLISSLLHEAAEAGCRRASTSLHHSELERLGFRTDGKDGRAYLDLDDPTRLSW